MRDENDLHRLVDGLLDAGRMGEVLLHLKTNPPEAARVAAWREQNELLRAAFAGVQEDPIPTSLRLTPLRLRCVSDDALVAELPPLAVTSLVQQDAPDLPNSLDQQSRRGYGVAASTLALVATTLIVSWLAVSWLAENHWAARSRPVAMAAGQDAGDRLVTPVVDKANETREGAAPALSDLPTTTIPDLGSLGFEFTGAAARSAPQKAIIFSYRGEPAVRLTISVSRQNEAEPGGAGQAGAIGWQRDGRSFVLAGTLDSDRLAVIAAYIQTTADASP